MDRARLYKSFRRLALRRSDLDALLQAATQISLNHVCSQIGQENFPNSRVQMLSHSGIRKVRLLRPDRRFGKTEQKEPARMVRKLNSCLSRPFPGSNGGCMKPRMLQVGPWPNSLWRRSRIRRSTQLGRSFRIFRIVKLSVLGLRCVRRFFRQWPAKSCSATFIAENSPAQAAAR
jgi:hypothetical protein